MVMLKKIFLALLVLFTAAQVIRPARDVASAATSRDDFLARHSPPATVAQTLRAACYDCHSNETRYPWYAQVQPFGWMLDKHVREGRRALNFSEFGRLPAKRARKKLEACIDAVSDGQMPLRSYTWIHRDAKLSEREADALVAWMETEAQRNEGGLAKD